MRNTSDTLLLACDFETTVYDGQTETEVWSAAFAELYTDEVQVLGSLPDFLKYLIKLKRNVRGWFHNLKFDGNFIISYLLSNGWKWDNSPDYEMRWGSFKALISSKNRFYSVTIRTKHGKFIELWDSVKLIPFTLEQAGKAFGTEHQKLTMEYKGRRYANCPISLEERAYIINDVLVLKEILEILLNRDMKRMTIGSVCLNEYKHQFDKFEWDAMFPDLRNIPCDFNADENAETFIRRTYKGAWCYLKKEGEYTHGATYDVNSLYSSVMHSKSGNYYPVGNPHFFTGQIPDICNRKDIVWFVHVRCKFEIKPKHLPTIQIKHTLEYRSNKWLTTSRFEKRGKYYDFLIDSEGNKHYARPDLYLTMKDYELLLAHYDVEDLEIISGAWFTGELGLFDEYIDEWMGRKIAAKDDKVERTIDKLYLNNLYGKFASSDDASYMEPFLDEQDIVRYKLIESHDKPVLYIPVGSMVTAYARYFTITHAQKNYAAFIYADTDSIHMLDVEPVDIKIHETNLLCWKKESTWTDGKFIRQKTYAEKINGKWEVTCAGLPAKGKKMLVEEYGIDFFRIGMVIPKCKLTPKNIKGGVILVDSDFTLHKQR